MGLCAFLTEYKEAVECDLLTSTGYTLRDVGDTVSWGALREFISNAPAGSATAHALDPDLSSWGSLLKTNALLADIFDILNMINANICSLGSGKPARRPPKIERPGDKQNQKIGGHGMTATDLDAQLEKKRAEYKNRKG